jgi:type IV pilus assembly protein PilV
MEMLVSLLILAAGLLGMIGLLVESQRAERTAAYRAAAAHLASDIAERMRANPLAAPAYASGTGADHGCVNGVSDCAPADLAADDLHRWQDDIARQLPAGAAGNIALADGGPGRQVIITLSWPETGASGAASLAVVVRL